MRLANETPLPLAMIRNADQDDHITVVLAVALTCRIEQRRLHVAHVQRPIRVATRHSEVPDLMPRKDGVSVCATGFVYPKHSGSKEALATMQVGDHVSTVVAFGPRIWRKNALGQLRPSYSELNERVEMSWSNAFGGMTKAPPRVVKIDGEEAFVPQHDAGEPNNYDGIGFYLSEEQALGSPLPLLEDPSALIQNWNDRPEPICFAPYPASGGLRSKHIVRDGMLDMANHQRIACRSAPATTFSTIASSTRVELAGMRPDGDVLGFSIPEPPLQVQVQVGTQSVTQRMTLDAVDVDAETCEVRLLYRAEARYPLIQFEERLVLVQPTADFPDS